MNKKVGGLAENPRSVGARTYVRARYSRPLRRRCCSSLFFCGANAEAPPFEAHVTGANAFASMPCSFALFTNLLSLDRSPAAVALSSKPRPATPPIEVVLEVYR